jgi:arabinofuranosyltransferase
MPARVSAALTAAVLVAFAALIWHRRWMSDDGLIVLRTVRQLLAGNGPVFNAGERVEANTSTLWTFLLALPGLVPGLSLNWAAVVLGLVCSVGGLGLALDAARRLAGPGRLLVPFGGLAVAVLPPFWDFGTSGLETGLIVGWLGLCWWLLVRRLVARRAASVAEAPPAAGALPAGTAGDGRAWPVAVVLGLAPLVRPDLALFGLAGLVALGIVERRRGWQRLLGLAAAAAALPVAYEIFRAGYYGVLLPGTALAKEASVARWTQGLYYLADLVRTYVLAVPMVAVAVAAAMLAVRYRRALDVPTVAVLAVPWVAGVLLTLYVTRVGGDFMHARMLLPALFCALLPVAAVPLTRWTAVPLLVGGVWALACLAILRPAYDMQGPHGIANERMYYVDLVRRPHPIVAADFVEHPVAPEGLALLRGQPGGALAVPGPDRNDSLWWLYPTPGQRPTIVWLNLGVTGELGGFDVRVLDGVGLANPLAAHATGEPNGRIGHDKALPPEWFLADEGVTDTQYIDPAGTAAARAALACPATQDLIASYRAPLTPARFWANLTGAAARTGYRYDRDPRVAARNCS